MHAPLRDSSRMRIVSVLNGVQTASVTPERMSFAHRQLRRCDSEIKESLYDETRRHNLDADLAIPNVHDSRIPAKALSFDLRIHVLKQALELSVIQVVSAKNHYIGIYIERIKVL